MNVSRCIGPSAREWAGPLSCRTGSARSSDGPAVCVEHANARADDSISGADREDQIAETLILALVMLERVINHARQKFSVIVDGRARRRLAPSLRTIPFAGSRSPPRKSPQMRGG